MSERHIRPSPPTMLSDSSNGGTEEDIEHGSNQMKGPASDWDTDPRNALNFPAKDKVIMMTMVSLSALVITIGTSIVSPAQLAFQEKFHVGETVALLPLSLYVFSLAFGPVVGGPLSETIGRMPIFYVAWPCGAFFTLGAGFTNNFAALCVLRFLAGFCWAPLLSVAVGTISETFVPKTRGPMMAIFVLMPFLGPGFGPVLGAFAVSRQNWRWTQWVLEFFSIVCLVLIFFTKETYPPVIQRRIAKSQGLPVPPRPSVAKQIYEFAFTGLVRPLHMLVAEPIVVWICLYVAVNFGVLFSFFAAVPYMVVTVHHFDIEQSGLVFLSIVIGCILGMITVMLCDGIFYKPQAKNYPADKIPPEYRLYPAMIGSVGLPLGLFWFAWTSKPDISWASPIAAIIPYSWGNLCVFISTTQYVADTYHANIVASVASASTLSRYVVGGAFPLFILDMFKDMGLDWAISVFGFICIALMPTPWLLFKFGARLRARTKYETIL